MPLAQNAEPFGVILSAGVAGVAGFLAQRQWSERRSRSANLSPADARHFERQDFRRGIGALGLLLLALGLFIGSRLDPVVGGRANLSFVRAWFCVGGLVIFELILAM